MQDGVNECNKSSTSSSLALITLIYINKLICIAMGYMLMMSFVSTLEVVEAIAAMSVK